MRSDSTTTKTKGKAMKTTASILGTAILFAIGFIAITGCESPKQKNVEEIHKEIKEPEHTEGKVETGGHMEHMDEVQQWLKLELGDKYNQPVPPANKEQLTLGKETFTKICASCHGTSGKGDGPASLALVQKPADFTDPEHSKYYSDQGRIYIIKKGIKGTPMVGWESILNENEIQSVYTYVRSLRSSKNKEEHDPNDHEH